ncbi:MAG TPA: hypothetical protein VES40_06625 [Ilumatobacteraceae bacterium]|nr:hypothetical protein [Ilumatobacteraceae bacterium]
MADLIFVSIIVAFFALCVVYLQWCDRIIGPDEFSAERDDTASPYVATDATLVDASAEVAS